MVLKLFHNPIGGFRRKADYKNARLVGKVLSNAELYGDYPCHRVVNHAGRLAPGWQEQRFLLSQEDVTFRENGNVDLKKHLWEC